MTKISFFGKRGCFSGFLAAGHSSASENDEDGKLICSAVSSAVYLTANSLTDVFGKQCDIDVSDGRFELKIKSPDETASRIIEGLYIHIEQLSRQYPNRIRIITEV